MITVKITIEQAKGISNFLGQDARKVNVKFEAEGKHPTNSEKRMSLVLSEAVKVGLKAEASGAGLGLEMIERGKL